MFLGTPRLITPLEAVELAAHRYGMNSGGNFYDLPDKEKLELASVELIRSRGFAQLALLVLPDPNGDDRHNRFGEARW